MDCIGGGVSVFFDVASCLVFYGFRCFMCSTECMWGVYLFLAMLLSLLILLGFYMAILIMIHLLPSMNVSLFLFVNSEPVVIASCHRVIAFAAFEGSR